LGELPLSPYDSCRLGSIVLYRYVNNPFTDEAEFDIDTFMKDVYTAQVLMDIVIDLEVKRITEILNKLYKEREDRVNLAKELPYIDDKIFDDEIRLWENVRAIAKRGRRTGLGIMGLADTAAALGMKYGSKEFIMFADEIASKFALQSYKASIDMAEKLGPFEICQPEDELGSIDVLPNTKRIVELMEREAPEYLVKWRKYGRRNIMTMAIAPTGTISMMAGVSSGIEPVFMIKYKRKRRATINTKNAVRDKDGNLWEEFNVIHKPFKEWAEINGYKDVEKLSDKEFDELVAKSPYAGSTAHEIDPFSKVILQATMQKWIDHSISVTHNLPAGTKPDEVKELALFAYEQGVKGFTVYVDGSRVGILTSDKDKVAEAKGAAKKRPKRLKADVHNIVVRGVPWIVIVGLTGDKPYEVFAFKKNDKEINISHGYIVKVKSKHYALTDERDKIIVHNLVDEFESPEEEFGTRLISMGLRHGADMKFIYEQLNKSKGDITHFSKAISRVLKKYVKAEDLKSDQSTCPVCGSANLTMESGCVTCRDCGWSKCG
jgi:ribonucleoside-diphosphate reductase alpha chain